MKIIVLKIYYWLMVLSSLVVIVSLIALLIMDLDKFNDIFENRNVFTNIYDIAFIVIYVISILGLRGFIYKKRYFTKNLWKFIFFMLLIEYIGNEIYTFNDYDKLGHMLEAIGTLPILYALYEYIFKINDIWKNDDD